MKPVLQMPAPMPAGHRRILSLRLPNLPVDRLRRKGAFSAAQLETAPLVITDKAKGALVLAAVSGEARALGLRPGMTLADARAIVPVLTVAEADPAADARLLDGVADWCDRFTPLVAPGGPDGLLLDLTGCAHLFGGEAALLADLRGRLRRQGLGPALALAGTRGAAEALTRCACETIVPPGQEAAALAPLPVAALGLAGTVRHGLVRAGLKTIGDVEARGRGELTARFGAGLLRILDEALGRSDTILEPRRPPPAFMAERRFMDPVATAEVVEAVLRGLAGTLKELLEAQDKGLRQVEATFFRADGAVRRIAVETGSPVRDPALILRLLRERLDALADPIDPGFGFDLIRLSAGRVAPLHATVQELAARGDVRVLDEEALDTLIDQLAARLGGARVLRPLAQDTHIPEREMRLVPAQRFPREAAAPWPQGEQGEPPRRPLRLFARPEPLDVTAEVPDGPPVRFIWRRAPHRVAHAEGPERIAMEWWRHIGTAVPPVRDYFRVEDEAGRRFWIYRDGPFAADAPPRWFMHGLFA